MIDISISYSSKKIKDDGLPLINLGSYPIMLGFDLEGLSSSILVNLDGILQEF